MPILRCQAERQETLLEGEVMLVAGQTHRPNRATKGRKQEQGNGRCQLTAINYQREYIRQSRNSGQLAGHSGGKANKRGL